MKPPRKVSLFVSCIVDQFFPEVGMAAVEVLERCGLEVDFPEAQTCCGQPAFNSGFHEEARQVARAWMDAFAKSEVVVAPSGSCVSMVRNSFAEIFHGYPSERAEAKSLAARTFEFSEFLVKVLGRTDVGAPPWPKAVTLHESCHLLRELKVREPARQLLSAVPGLELREMERSEECCGFGGTFSVKFGPLSTALADDKLKSAAATGAAAVVACDMSCLMHLDGRARRMGIPIRCLHLAQVLAGVS